MDMDALDIRGIYGGYTAVIIGWWLLAGLAGIHRLPAQANQPAQDELLYLRVNVVTRLSGNISQRNLCGATMRVSRNNTRGVAGWYGAEVRAQSGY